VSCKGRTGALPVGPSPPISCQFPKSTARIIEVGFAGVRLGIPKRAVLMRGGETTRIGADACDSLRSFCFGLPGGSCSLAEKPASMSLTDRALRLRQGSRAQDAYSQGCG